MAERPRPRKCAIYTRKSSDEGLEQSFNSLDAQREAAEAYIASQRHEGWTAIRDHYDDGGFSGGTMERPALQRLLADIEASRVDVVLVYKVDRLTRSLTDFSRIIEVFDRRAISFVSVTQQFNTTTSMGRLTLNVLLSFAQFEREVTGERIRDKVRASRQKGMWMGGLPPLGFDIVERRLIVNVNEVPTVRHIFERYVAIRSVRRLRDELERDDVVSKDYVSQSGRCWGGTSFSPNALITLLRNRVYIGEVSHKDSVYPGEQEAIVDRTLWLQAQEILGDGREQRRAASRYRSPLAGLLRDEHGESLTPTHAVKKAKRYRYYVSRSLTTGSSAPDSARGWRVPARDLEQIVVDAVASLLTDRGRLHDALRTIEPRLAADATAYVRASEVALALQRAEGLTQSGGIGTLIDAVTISDMGVEVTLSTQGLVHAARLGIDALEMPRAPATSDDSRPMRLLVSAQLRRSGKEMRLVLDDETARKPMPDDDLIMAVARARLWHDQLVTGRSPSIRELSRSEGIDERHLRRTLQLACLAPDIIVAIVEGRQPPELTARRLRDIDLPLRWDEQRAVLGFR